jgi:hypothetical protein
MVVFLSEKVLHAPISDDKRLNQEVSVLQNHHRKNKAFNRTYLFKPVCGLRLEN